MDFRIGCRVWAAISRGRLHGRAGKSLWGAAALVCLATASSALAFSLGIPIQKSDLDKAPAPTPIAEICGGDAAALRRLTAGFKAPAVRPAATVETISASVQQ